MAAVVAVIVDVLGEDEDGEDQETPKKQNTPLSKFNFPLLSAFQPCCVKSQSACPEFPGLPMEPAGQFQNCASLSKSHGINKI